MAQELLPLPEATAPTAVRSRRSRPAHEVRDRRRRLVTWMLVLGSFVLIVNALFGDHGYLAAARARQEYRTLSEEVGRIRTENAQYLDEIRGIKSDPAVLEDAARRELGLVRRGETLVIIHNGRSATAPAPPK